MWTVACSSGCWIRFESFFYPRIFIFPISLNFGIGGRRGQKEEDELLDEGGGGGGGGVCRVRISYK